MNQERHSKHLFRAFFLLLFALIGLFTVRGLLIPESYGEKGHYRADNLEEQAMNTLVHGGRGSCTVCHEETAGKIGAGAHKRLSCEGCHAPLSVHAKDGKKIADMPKTIGPDDCLRCHAAMVSRPDSFPQIDKTKHLDENSSDPEEFKSQGCRECHNPHAPE